MTKGVFLSHWKAVGDSSLTTVRTVMLAVLYLWNSSSGPAQKAPHLGSAFLNNLLSTADEYLSGEILVPVRQVSCGLQKGNWTCFTGSMWCWAKESQSGSWAKEFWCNSYLIKALFIKQLLHFFKGTFKRHYLSSAYVTSFPLLEVDSPL